MGHRPTDAVLKVLSITLRGESDEAVTRCNPAGSSTALWAGLTLSILP